ncbi:Cation/acetate symporter ActP [Streptomyces badius]
MKGDHQTLALLLFSAFIAVTLFITTWVGRHRQGSAEEFYAGGRLFSPMENGFAIAGDYMSAASFLGISGLIALFGYDGMLYSVGFLVAWLVVLLLVAELVRNCGRFTLADVVAARMAERPVRTAVGTSSVTVSVLYLVAQMVGAGSLVALLLGGTSDAARSWTVVGVGALMVIYVSFGGMRATTWIQIVKAVLLMAGALALTVLVLVHFHGNINTLLNTAAERSGHGKDFLAPGLRYGGDWTSRFDFISLGVALVLGTAGLPHILSRFYTVPTARAARRSVVSSIGLIGSFYLMTIVLGFGAAALDGSAEVRASNAAGDTAIPLLALDLGGGEGSTGGTILFAVVAAIAFATILAVVAGITLASSASVAHDLYASLRRPGRRSAARSPWRVSPPPGSARSQSVSGCSPRTSTSPSWWASPSPWPPPPTFRSCSTRCLAQLHHPGRGLVGVRRSGPGGRPGAGLTRRLGQPDVPVPRRRLPALPAGKPGPGLDPARLPGRLDRYGHLARAARRGQARRGRGAGAHGGRGGVGVAGPRAAAQPAAQAYRCSGRPVSPYRKVSRTLPVRSSSFR